MSKLENVAVLAGRGAAVPVTSGDEVSIVNVSGTQVVDFWCLPTSSPQEYLSLEHCREVLGKIYFAPGDVLVGDTLGIVVLVERKTGHGQRDGWKDEARFGTAGPCRPFRIEGQVGI